MKDHRAARTRRRVPTRFQLTKTECGAACLAMVVSYHGRETGIPEARGVLETGRDGTSITAIGRAAEQLGLDTRIDTAPEGWAAPMDGPFIAYLARRHFVVVTRVSRRHVYVVDPGAGRYRLERAEFAKQYGGVLLRLKPGPHFERRRLKLREVTMIRYVRDFVAMPGGRARLALAVVLAAGLQLLGLAAPLTTKVIMDSVLPQGHTGTIGLFLLGSLALAVLCGLLGVIRGLAMLAVRIYGDQRLSRQFIRHLFALPLGFFSDRGRGDLLMRLSSVSSTREALTQQLLTTVLDSFLLSGYVVGLIVTAPLFALAVIPLFILEFLVVGGSYRRIRLLSQHELTAKTEEQSYLIEVLEAISALKANGVEQRSAARWEQLFAAYQKVSRHRGRWTAVIAGAQRGLALFGPLALLWLGAWMVLTHRLGIGSMLAANGVALSVLSPIQTFANTGQLYQGIRAQVERVFDVLDSPREETGTVRLSGTGPMGVALNAVNFSYPGALRPTLIDVSVLIEPGQKLGIVGRTGSGKSTLGLLILGLYPPQSGDVRYDGAELTELDLNDLRSRCGAVLQDLTLFDGSIRNNLALSRPDADLEEIVRAAKMAGLHDDVVALPMGYETVVGQGGGGLSAGQRQRVALARALVHRPRLLLLDEATSHLDPETERRVDAALSELAITRVVISHRANAVRNADRIIALDQGRIVQNGTHQDLIEQDGVYRDLFGDADARDGEAVSVGGPIEVR